MKIKQGVTYYLCRAINAAGKQKIQTLSVRADGPPYPAGRANPAGQYFVDAETGDLMPVTRFEQRHQLAATRSGAIKNEITRLEHVSEYARQTAAESQLLHRAIAEKKDN